MVMKHVAAKGVRPSETVRSHRAGNPVSYGVPDFANQSSGPHAGGVHPTTLTFFAEVRPVRTSSPCPK